MANSCEVHERFRKLAKKSTRWYWLSEVSRIRARMYIPLHKRRGRFEGWKKIGQILGE